VKKIHIAHNTAHIPADLTLSIAHLKTSF